MSRTRVALVANNIHFRGGMERYCAELANHLCHDYDVHLFASEIDDVPLDRVTIHPVPVVKRPILALFLQFYVQSSRKIRFKDFDIVHTIGGITARQNVLTAQYCQYAWGDAIAQEAGAADGINAYHHLMWRMTGRFEKRAVNSAETQVVSANSHRTKNDLERFYGADPEKISVVHNGVDSLRFSPANRRFRGEVRRRYGIDEDAVLILFVGEYRRKGLATAIRAMGLVNDPRLHLLAVGKGNQEEYAEIAREAGVSERLTLAGPSRDIERVFGAADMFVFPTFYEPFGMVITEAMASGLPVITSRRAGAAELIAEGQSGFLVERPGDAQELAEKVQALLDDPALRTAVGENAREAASTHDWKKVGEQTVDLYARITGNARPGPAPLAKS